MINQKKKQKTQGFKWATFHTNFQKQKDGIDQKNQNLSLVSITVKFLVNLSFTEVVPRSVIGLIPPSEQLACLFNKYDLKWLVWWESFYVAYILAVIIKLNKWMGE